MTEIKQRLFDAFKADHALLGSGFYALATYLRDKNVTGAKAAAAKIDTDAGPHIAFEEEDFYPALKRFVGQQELDAMYVEHERGRALLEKVMALDDSTDLSETVNSDLLGEVDGIQSHISECGELFGVMGGLSDSELEELLEKLIGHQLNAPNWLSRPKRSVPTGQPLS